MIGLTRYQGKKDNPTRFLRGAGSKIGMDERLVRIVDKKLVNDSLFVVSDDVAPRHVIDTVEHIRMCPGLSHGGISAVGRTVSLVTKTLGLGIQGATLRDLSLVLSVEVVRTNPYNLYSIMDIQPNDKELIDRTTKWVETYGNKTAVDMMRCHMAGYNVDVASSIMHTTSYIRGEMKVLKALGMNDDKQDRILIEHINTIPDAFDIRDKAESIINFIRKSEIDEIQPYSKYAM